MPPIYRVIILPRAFSDLDRILSYIARSSPQNAVKVIDRLWAQMRALDQLPFRYPVHEHRKDPAKSVRSMPVPPFVVYYRVDKVQRVVRILCVYHGHQRQPRRFR